MFNKNPFAKQEEAKLVTPNNNLQYDKVDQIRKQMGGDFGIPVEPMEPSIPNDLPENNINDKMQAMNDFNRNNMNE